MFPRPYINPPDEPEVINLAEDKTLKGYGRRGDGLNGKDADLLECGQIVVTEAWWFPEAIEAVVYSYATETHEDCDGCRYGDCDGVELSTPSVTIRLDVGTDDEAEALKLLYDAITNDPRLMF